MNALLDHVNAYAAPAEGEALVPTTISRRDLGPNDVLIEIKFSGICHSDIHTVRGEWGPKPYPLVVGHEIAGIVTGLGADVTTHQIGDRVGVGCLVNSCGECSSCAAGDDQYCVNGSVGTYGSVDRDGTITQGGYSSHIVVDARFALNIPDSIDLDEAAPLLCAGITTYSPLAHWKVGPGSRVAVIGLGGLGHMAVKLAHAMGAEVTVLSQSLKKQEDGKRLGADHYFATSDPETFTRLADAFDLIINTVSANIDLNAMFGLLALNGTLVSVGISPDPAPIRAGNLLRNRRSYAGSLIGGVRQTQEMLDFCGEHGIGADVEIISADQINEAYERVMNSDVRYRFVIDASTLTPTTKQ